MGSGKSTAFIKAADRNLSKVIFVVPLRINDQQLSKRNNLRSRSDELDDVELTKILANERFIICVYESLSKIYSLLRKLNDVASWVVVFDEVHNFVSQARMRGMVFRLIRQILPQFKKTIYLSGTPEGVFHCLNTYSKNLVSHRFINNNGAKDSGHLTLIPTLTESFDILTQHLVNNPTDGLTVIAIENKRLLLELKEILTSVFENSPTEIINAEEKEGTLFYDLVVTGLVSNHLKYLLTTSVISDGCDIDNENIDAFYSLDWNDLNKLRQMHSRFRKTNGKTKYYDIFQEKSDIDPGVVIHIHDTFNLWCQSLENNLSFMNMPINRSSVKDFQSLPNQPFYYQSYNKIYIDRFLVQYRIMAHFFKDLRDPETRKSFYSNFSIFKKDNLSIEKINFNSKTSKYINECVLLKRKKNLLVELFNNSDSAVELLRKTSDDRFKTEKYSEVETSLFQLQQHKDIVKVIKYFNSLNIFIKNTQIVIALLSYEEKKINELVDWMEIMNIYYKIKNHNQRAFKRNEKQNADIIRIIVKNISSDNNININDTQKKSGISKFLIKKNLQKIFIVKQLHGYSGRGIYNIESEISLKNLLQRETLDLYGLANIEIPVNSELF